MERLLVHPGRPDVAGGDTALDRADAPLHSCRVGIGPQRFLRCRCLDQPRSGRRCHDESRGVPKSFRIFIMVVDSTRMDLAGLRRHDGGPGPLHARPVDACDVDSLAGGRGLVCEPGSRSPLWPRQAQRRVDPLPGHRSQWQGRFARPLARALPLARPSLRFRGPVPSRISRFG